MFILMLLLSILLRTLMKILRGVQEGLRFSLSPGLRVRRMLGLGFKLQGLEVRLRISGASPEPSFRR